jgi:hypothetical protein
MHQIAQLQMSLTHLQEEAHLLELVLMLIVPHSQVDVLQPQLLHWLVTILLLHALSWLAQWLVQQLLLQLLLVKPTKLDVFGMEWLDALLKLQVHVQMSLELSQVVLPLLLTKFHAINQLQLPSLLQLLQHVRMSHVPMLPPRLPLMLVAKLGSHQLLQLYTMQLLILDQIWTVFGLELLDVLFHKLVPLLLVTPQLAQHSSLTMDLAKPEQELIVLQFFAQMHQILLILIQHAPNMLTLVKIVWQLDTDVLLDLL